MDDLNRRMQDAERARARARQAVLEQRYARGEGPDEILELRRVGGGFALGDRALADGDELEVFLAGAGWVAGRFRAGSPPVLRLRLGHPTDPAVGGEASLALPEGAVCRPRG